MAYKKILKLKVKNLLILFAIVAFFLLILKPSFASSPYVLPYPSSMPGSSIYKFHLIYEKLSEFKYFGDFGRYKYNLRYADKYLVEAKTLFEYNQYLLGYKALEKSNIYFEKIRPSLQSASINSKNISEKNITLSQAAEKHEEILESMKINTPTTFNWQPEKSSPTVLSIHELIGKSIMIRKNK